MINTPPSERPPPPPTSHPQPRGLKHLGSHSDAELTFAGHAVDRKPYSESSGPNTPRILDDYNNGMLPAASALAQLHNNRLESDWESEQVSLSARCPSERLLTHDEGWHSDTEPHMNGMRPTIELPPLRRSNPTSDPYNPLNRPRTHLSALLSNSPPGRSSTLPPIQRHPPNRPRKNSITKRVQEPQHRRRKSRETQLQAHMRRMSYDRKAFSAEPSAGLAAYGKRWEDLIDAATSATEDVNDDRTPVSIKPRHNILDFGKTLTSQMPLSPRAPNSPSSINRSSLPPYNAHFHVAPSYQASPLQQALTPPSHDAGPIPFPSVESGDSSFAPKFETRDVNLSDSSPMGGSQTQIYCAACQNISLLNQSYACTECICGLCQPCVEVLVAEQGARRRCPRCATVGGKFKPFQLEIR